MTPHQPAPPRRPADALALALMMEERRAHTTNSRPQPSPPKRFSWEQGQ